MLLNIGRVFELLIASLVGPLTDEDIRAIMGRAPFFSTAALAPTKTITIEDDDDKAVTQEDESTDEDLDEGPNISSMVSALRKDIEEWRDRNQVAQIELSPWLVYKVFNKVFSQVASDKSNSNGMKNIRTALNMAAHTFYTTWFAFGSFEKGDLLGLPNVIATTNINPDKLKKYTSNEQYTFNVKPILDAYNKDNSLKTVSVVLENHPLKEWIDELIKLDWPKPVEDREAQAEKYLREKLGITAKTVTLSTIKTRAKKQTEDLNSIYQHMRDSFGADNKYTKYLKEAIDELKKGSTSNSQSKNSKDVKKVQDPAEAAQPQAQPEVQQPEQKQPPTETTQPQPESLPADQERDKDSK
ncbi:hypothetical protein NMR67_003345 [Vibrio cholerae]|nr:hypothetical protein [Vibrio cholerae]